MPSTEAITADAVTTRRLGGSDRVAPGAVSAASASRTARSYGVDPALDRRDRRRDPARPPSSASTVRSVPIPFAMQTAIASASAASSGVGSVAIPSTIWTIRWTCSLSAAP